MKKLLTIISILSMFVFITTNAVAQEQEATNDSVAKVEAVDQAASTADATKAEATIEEEAGIHKVLKQKFIEGGAGFMAAVTFCLIFGLALAIERILYLSLASANTKKLLNEIEKAFENEGVEKAKEICRNTRGPVASIFYQGLSRYDEGIEVVEKTVSSYGSVQLGLLEKNLSWIGLFIALAPMLGFMGTVIGMIEAFDKIQQVGDISATVVAGGIKVALLTTVMGLIVAVILQMFYNFILAKIDNLVNDMENSSISLLDIIVKYSKK